MRSLLPNDKLPAVKVSVPTESAEPKVAVPLEVLLSVKVDNRLVVPGVVTSKFKVPNEPVPLMIKPELPPPLNLPEPDMVLLTDALPAVSTKPFKSNTSVELVSVMTLPPFGPSVNKSFNILTLPDALLETI